MTIAPISIILTSHKFSDVGSSGESLHLVFQWWCCASPNQLWRVSQLVSFSDHLPNLTILQAAPDHRKDFRVLMGFYGLARCHQNHTNECRLWNVSVQHWPCEPVHDNLWMLKSKKKNICICKVEFKAETYFSQENKASSLRMNQAQYLLWKQFHLWSQNFHRGYFDCCLELCTTAFVYVAGILRRDFAYTD